MVRNWPTALLLAATGSAWLVFIFPTFLGGVLLTDPVLSLKSLSEVPNVWRVGSRKNCRQKNSDHSYEDLWFHRHWEMNNSPEINCTHEPSVRVSSKKSCRLLRMMKRVHGTHCIFHQVAVQIRGISGQGRVHQQEFLRTHFAAKGHWVLRSNWKELCTLRPIRL